MEGERLGGRPITRREVDGYNQRHATHPPDTKTNKNNKKRERERGKRKKRKKGSGDEKEMNVPRGSCVVSRHRLE